MTGFVYNFDIADIDLTSSGSVATDLIDSQNCALISLCELCRISAPEIGASLAAKLINRKWGEFSSDIATATRMVERDGGRRVSITLDTNGQLYFRATYA